MFGDPKTEGRKGKYLQQPEVKRKEDKWKGAQKNNQKNILKRVSHICFTNQRKEMPEPTGDILGTSGETRGPLKGRL